MKMRSVAVVLVLVLLLVSALALAGCAKKGIEGQWFLSEKGKVITIDKDWMTDAEGTQVRYVATGDTALQVTKGSTTEDVRYEVKGDTLTISGGHIDGTYYRVGSSAYKDAKAAWDKKQAEEKAKKDAAAAEDKKQEDQQKCESVRRDIYAALGRYWQGLVDGSLGGGKFRANSYASDTEAIAHGQKVNDKIHAEFPVGMAADDIVAMLLKVGKNSDGQYGSNAPVLPEDAGKFKCPDSGVITLTGWQQDSYFPLLTCSVHGDEQ